MKSCYGDFKNEGQCDTCPLVFSCIEVTIDIDNYYDELADRQLIIEEMESDVNWTQLV